MLNRANFGLHKPEPAIKITETASPNASFTVVLNDLSLAMLQIGVYKNIAGMSILTANSSLTVTIAPGNNFNVCDSAFRSMLGKLNAENCGLSLKDLDKVVKGFNDFLKANHIHSEFANKLRDSHERENPGNNMAF